jgi:hypothetical protein
MRFFGGGIEYPAGFMVGTDIDVVGSQFRLWQLFLVLGSLDVVSTKFLQ